MINREIKFNKTSVWYIVTICYIWLLQRINITVCVVMILSFKMLLVSVFLTAIAECGPWASDSAWHKKNKGWGGGGGPLAKSDLSPGRESTQRLCTCFKLSSYFDATITIDSLKWRYYWVFAYIIDIFMIHQFQSNMTSDHQPKISNYLKYLVPDWLSAPILV